MKKNKKILIILIIACACILLGQNNVNAGLQANQDTQYTLKTGQSNWIKWYRQMETAGGTLGLSETLNADLTASSASNNLDSHMCKTSEYGTMAILSASSYGNPSNEKIITSSTGNKTGVILNTSNWENTAGGYSGTVFKNVNGIYYDSYGNLKVGDALGECNNWHSAVNGGTGGEARNKAGT